MKRTKAPVKPTEKQKVKTKPASSSSLNSTMYIICAVFAFLLYSNTLNHEFAYDDFPTIYGNQITMKGFAGIPELLHTSYWYGLNGEEDWLYRPLSMVMFAAEWGIAPKTPALGHWINVLLYALTAVVLIRFLCNMFEGKNILLPFAVTLIWIAHPIHTEVVANIKSRDEILCFLFCILALDNFLCYIKAPEISLLVKACVFYFLALMSKESAITLVAVIPLMIYCFSQATLKRNMMISAIAIVPAGVYMTIRAIVLSDVLNISDIPLSDNALVGANGNFNLEKGTAFYMLGLYLKLLFFPHPMSIDYSFNEIPLVPLTNPVSLFALFAYFGFGIYALIRIPKKDPVAFGILYFLIIMSIVANVLFLTRSTMAERFLYMPSLGFAIVIVILTGRLFKIDFNAKFHFARLENLFSYNKNFSYLVCIILLAASIKTIARNPDWKNDTTIFSADAVNAPNSSRVHFLYANHMVQEVKENKVPANEIENYYNIAIEEFNKCIAIHPDHYQSYFGLGDLYEQKKQPDKALYYYRTVVQRLPKLQLGYFNLGNMYFKVHQYDSSITVLQKAISLQPDFAGAYNSLGAAYFGKGDFDNAITVYKKTLALKPDYADAWKNLGSCYGTKKEYDLAIDAFQKALSFAPNDADIKRFLDMTVQMKNQAGK
ncbi:MAG TPA: tetratricopeptide repeat protein [Bacteroidia bacterium]|nr:tetratricopeptide repeat protein [Bacteroidia bacterium]